jgi:hypothetical protein
MIHQINTKNDLKNHVTISVDTEKSTMCYKDFCKRHNVPSTQYNNKKCGKVENVWIE